MKTEDKLILGLLGLGALYLIGKTGNSTAPKPIIQNFGENIGYGLGSGVSGLATSAVIGTFKGTSSVLKPLETEMRTQLFNPGNAIQHALKIGRYR